MRVFSGKGLVAMAALGAVAGSLGFICAKGLNFSDPDPVRPAMTLREPAWPSREIAPAAPERAAEVSREMPSPRQDASLPTPVLAPLPTPSPAPLAAPGIGFAAGAEQSRTGTDAATQLLNGFLGQGRPDSGHTATIPPVTPDQAALAARGAADLINGLIANQNGREGHMDARTQLDRDQAAAAAETAARLLNGMFKSRSLAPTDRNNAGDAAPTGLEEPAPEKRSDAAPLAPQPPSGATTQAARPERKHGNDIRVDPRAVKEAMRALGM